jgi:hypothetical protein
MVEGEGRCWSRVGRLDDGHKFERGYLEFSLVTESMKQVDFT